MKRLHYVGEKRRERREKKKKKKVVFCVIKGAEIGCDSDLEEGKKRSLQDVVVSFVKAFL